MDTLWYDGTFEGFLTAVFVAFEKKLATAKITRHLTVAPLFGKAITIAAEAAKAARVWSGLEKKLSKEGLHYLYCSFLADTLTEEDNMLAYIRHIFSNAENIENDYSNFAVMRMQRVERMVHRESHRMKAFIRFKLTKDHIYYTAIKPDFDVIPLISGHFQKRYADQQWLIYDLKRGYGIYYDLQQVQIVNITFAEEEKGTGQHSAMHENEELFQTLWQQYFKSTNIASRKNMKLHIRHMPLRYWRYLSEKQISGKELL